MLDLPRLKSWVAAGLAGLFLVGVPGRAAEFSVAPIRLELGPSVRSGALVVRNDSKEKISFQLEAMEWTQDEKGADRYAGTADLIFFPKILGVDPGEEAIVRVGAKRPIVPVEKTYRIFIQELPNPNRASTAAGGPQVNLLLRFGAPVFVTPAQAADDAELTVVSLDKGVLNLSVKNTGNRHQVMEGIHLKGLGADGQELYALTLADRYLLAGTSKAFAATIPADTCRRLVAITMELKTDRLSRTRKLDVSRANCL